MAPIRPWKEAAAAAQKHRDESLAKVNAPDPGTNLPLNVTAIPRELLTAREVEITESSPESILSLLSQKQWTCAEVTSAFLRRAAIAHKLVNCVTELLPERAMDRAKWLDRQLETTGKPVGPLHGLPISVKEHVAMKGLDLNIGYCSWVGNIAEDDALILKILYKAGAVFYARTTEPQTLMHLETSSNIYGVTVNPFNRKLTAGGSSGGEGAMLGLRASCLGVGSDIGGSIRCPAANNGVFGLKPTSWRLPLSGIEPLQGGTEPVLGTVGPLSTSFESLKLFLKVVVDAKPWLVEPSLIPLPWHQESYFLDSGSGRRRKLKVAVLWDDGVVKPHPPINRALRETAERIRKSKDIDVVDWKPYQHDEAWKIIASLYYCDGGQQDKDYMHASGEPWRPLSTFIIKDNPYVKHLAISEVWDWAKRREDYRTAYAKLWNETATGTDANGEPEGMVDVILSPVGPGAAPPLDCARYWGYTSQWNLLDYPAMVFPVSQVDPAIEDKDDDYVPRNEQDKYNHDLYEPEKYRDAPLSLQLIGRRYEEEKVLEAYEILQKYIS